MVKTILEMLVIASLAMVMLTGGKIMLTTRIEQNQEKLSYLKFLMIAAMGVCFATAYLLAAVQWS